MTVPFEELLVFALLLLGVVGVYILLKLHYIFAFGLMKNTASYEKNKDKIVKIKNYVFLFLKILLWLGLLAVLIFGSSMLSEGLSLKTFVLDSWGKIPDGFWRSLLFALLRIAVLVVISRYLLRKIFSFLVKQKQKTINKKVYNRLNVEKAYFYIYNTIKYTVVLGVVYRIMHFFPFLEEVSAIMFVFLVLFFVGAVSLTLGEMLRMLKEKKEANNE